MKQLFFLFLMLSLLTSCLGDRKPIDLEELEDTGFVNKNFKANLIDYVDGMSACEQLSSTDIASLYGVSANLIHIEDPTKSDRYRKDILPMCGFFLESGENDYEWLRGGISLQPEVSKDAQMGEIAEAAGRGENWEEAWALKKSITKSAEWVEGLGLAALWIDSKAQLEIKFKGYTLVINPLKNSMNKKELAAKRDYKKIAIAMAKAAGYIN